MRFLWLISIAPTVFAQEERTSAALSMGVNFSGLQPLLDSIQRDLLPDVVLAANRFLDDNLAVSTTAGSCCDDGDFGIRLSAKMDRFVLNTDLNTVTITQEDESAGTSSTVRVNASSMDLGVTVSSTIEAVVPLLGQLSCSIGLGAETRLSSLDMALGVSTSDSNDILIDAKEAKVPSLGVTMRAEETGDACDLVSGFLAEAINLVVGEIEPLVLSFFNENLVKALAEVIDDTIVPIAQFDTSFSLGNMGIISPSFALETISPISNTFVVDVGASLDVELTQPAFRAGRSLSASGETTPNTMPRVSVDNLLGMHLRYVYNQSGWIALSHTL